MKIDTNSYYPFKRADLNVESLLYDLVLENAKANPKNIAVIQNQINLTYEELISLSFFYVDKIINHYKAKEGDCIAIFMPKSWAQVIACLAISMAGCVFVPINFYEAKDRLTEILESAQINLIISDQDNNVSLPVKYSILKVKMNEKGLGNTRKGLRRLNPQSPAYVIYTSGTTGKPKGVIISHQNVVNTIVDINQRFKIDHQHKVLGLSELNFDLAIYDIFGLLSVGGSIVYPQQSELKQPSEWIRLISNYKINLWNSVPAYLELLLEFCKQKKQSFLKNLKIIFLSGDWISLNLAKYVRNEAFQTKLVSLGGATEASIWSLYYDIDKIDPKWKSIPYGKPLSNQSCYILNNYLKEVSFGEIGDIYIGGAGVGLGYLNDLDKTIKSFIKNEKFDTTLYKTGDLGHYDEHGNIILIGRSDNQVKINGFRIEIGEIESCLNDFEGISKSVVTIKQRKVSQTSLIIAHLILDYKIIDIQKLRKHIFDKLPVYMHPHHFRIINNIPLTLNGKVDRAKLTLSFGEPLFIPKTIENFLLDDEKQYNNFYIKKLIEAISKVLNINDSLIKAQDNFFHLGGDSIAALKLIGILAQEGYKINFNDIFNIQTISNLAEKMETDLSNEFQISLEDKPISYNKQDIEYERILSNDQKGIVFQCEFFSNPELYVGQVIAEVNENINTDLFGAILNNLICSNPILREGYVLDENIESFVVEVADLSKIYTLYYKAIANEDIYTIERKKGIDLASPPLIRFALLIDKIALTTEIIITFHHALLDGISCVNFMGFLYDIYKKSIRGEIILDLKYSKPKISENKSNSTLVEEQNYWVNLLKNYVLYEKYYPEAENLRFSTKTFFLPYQTDKLKEVCKYYSTNMTELLIALWGLTLLDHHNAENFCFGLVISLDSQQSKSLGFFIRTPPFLIERESDFSKIVLKVRGQLNSLSKYGNISLSDVRHWLNCPYDKYLYGNILIIDNYTKNKKQALQLNNLYTTGYTHYPLAATISEVDNGYNLKLDFHANIFSDIQINSLGVLFLKNIERLIDLAITAGK